MIEVIHRVPDGSVTLTANCGQALGLGDGNTGWYGADPLVVSSQRKCTRGCYPTEPGRHRRDLSPIEDGDAISEMRASLTGLEGGKHRDEVAA